MPQTLRATQPCTTTRTESQTYTLCTSKHTRQCTPYTMCPTTPSDPEHVTSNPCNRNYARNPTCIVYATPALKTRKYWKGRVRAPGTPYRLFFMRAAQTHVRSAVAHKMAQEAGPLGLGLPRRVRMPRTRLAASRIPTSQPARSNPTPREVHAHPCACSAREDGLEC